MKRFLALFLFAAATLAGCSDDGKDEGKDVRLAPGTSKDYTIYADQTSGTSAEGISFTTTGPWRATVTETRAAGGWVTVSPDHGDAAGDYTITISLGVNTSGADRKATVTIECGATKITITVEQKGTTEEGEIPDSGDEPGPAGKKLISELYFYFPQNPDQEWQRCELTYDDRNRLIRWRNAVNEILGGGSTVTLTETITYEYGEGLVRITSDDKEDGTSFTVYLNGAGYAERAEKTNAQDGKTRITRYAYDAENRLIRTEQDDEREDYIWQNGNLVEIRYGSESETNSTWFTYTEHENRESLDIIPDRVAWDEELVMAGLLGIQSRNLVRTQKGDEQSYGKDDLTFSYEFDTDGYVTRTVAKDTNHTDEDNNPRTLEIKHIAGRK